MELCVVRQFTDKKVFEISSSFTKTVLSAVKGRP